MIRSDLECETRTNLPINHCAEMLTRTLIGGLKISFYYKRAFNSAPSSSNPGLPRRANIFFL
ncbi:hypothetical protein FAJ35_08530 [Streptococcus suis]|uniref:Uncharacterized protein n=1 Tax=Streptococcus suis TaxID=1307 RepID=A0A3R8N4U7_STRSU|nr:hypothetical protein EI219_08345 [Streptococcus suis]TII00680.1 hypothetical protein FAJ35_08530 [Streptococcus suis]